MKAFAVTTAAVVLLFGAHASFAGPVQKREKKQENRIESGEKSGKLTPKESQRLENQQEIVEKERQQALEDGKMSKRERRDIKHDQNRLSQDIHRKKHNAKRTHPQSQ